MTARRARQPFAVRDINNDAGWSAKDVQLLVSAGCPRSFLGLVFFSLGHAPAIAQASPAALI